MTAFVSTINTAGLNRIVIEQQPEGVYVFGFRTEGSIPEFDYLDGDWEGARRRCQEDWGVPSDSWRPTQEHPQEQSFG